MTYQENKPREHIASRIAGKSLYASPVAFLGFIALLVYAPNPLGKALALILLLIALAPIGAGLWLILWQITKALRGNNRQE